MSAPPPDPDGALTAEQRAAIEDRERDLFLIAGAGSGKTTVLVERFCEIVTEPGGAEIDELLAFTFTERAAASLQRRIRAELAARARAAEPAGAKQLRALARESEGAWISTIHAFCHRLLSNHALLAGLDPRFSVLDEDEAARLRVRAFDRAFTAFGAAAVDDDRFEVAAAVGYDRLRDTVSGAYDELRALGQARPILPELEPVDPAAAASELIEAAAALTEELRADEAKQFVARALEKVVAVGAVLDGGEVSEDDPRSWLIKSKSPVLSTPAVERYNHACRSLERALVESASAHHYDHLRELVSFYGLQYAGLKRSRSALDFEDLQLTARDLLASNAAVRAAYQRRFRHLMVDEFQDTNALQSSLIALLHFEQGEPRNALFTVGDALQSIYAFRHADLEVFRAGARAAEAAPDERSVVRRLTANFRSSGPVLALVNALGEQLLGPDFSPLVLGGPGAGPGAAEILVTEREGWPKQGLMRGVSDDEQAQPWRLAEARALAARLRALVDGGERRGDIVVLLRSYTHVEAYERALEDVELAPYVIGGRRYWSRLPVSDVRALLGCVANPTDDRALISALASPACAVRPDTLWLLTKAAAGAPVLAALELLASDDPGSEDDWSQNARALLGEIPADDVQALHDFATRLERVRKAAHGLTLEGLIDRVIAETGYDLAMLMAPGGRRRMANIRKLMALAREFEAAEGRDLRGFLDQIELAVSAGSREPDATIQVEGHDGVRIMTIHAAKGLEFPVVAVADLGRGLGAVGAGSDLRVAAAAPGSDRLRVGLRLARLGRPRKAILDHAEIAEQAVARDREEERRLLHVAMTRAERLLILSGACRSEALAEDPSPTEPLLSTALRVLGWSPAIERLTIPGAPALLEDPAGPTDPVEVEVSLTVPPDLAEAVDPVQLRLLTDPERDASAAVEIGPLRDPEMLAPASGAARPVTHASYSSLSLFDRCGYRFYVERVLGLGGGAAPVAISSEAEGLDPAPEQRFGLGTVVHELLEHSANRGFAAADQVQAAALLEREGVGQAELERATGLVDRFLGSGVRKRLDGGVIHAETPFLLSLGGLILRGEIDLLAIFPIETILIDYKTDRLGESDPADHMGRYEIQRKLYALASLERYERPVTVIYAFLDRPEAPIEACYEPADRERLRRDLEAVCSELVAGRFAVTDDPRRALCFDCPARERLCSHPASMTLRD
ncbi:MAG: UvrD-helicase domain-containing protein [Thermoleophilaceae bacterium]|nr:UvrD-helicase domain-containing protein [Thermoleophilaceae bacterium]